jgi:hypothetical protein
LRIRKTEGNFGFGIAEFGFAGAVEFRLVNKSELEQRTKALALRAIRFVSDFRRSNGPVLTAFCRSERCGHAMLDPLTGEQNELRTDHG